MRKDHMFRVYGNGVSGLTLHDDVTRLRNDKARYDLWIDLDSREVIEKEIGKIDLFSKRILGRLLCFLIMNPGKRFAADELYFPVWRLSVNELSEETSVRTSISRLRQIIEPRPPMWKYILKTAPTFLGRRGEYYFDNTCSHCLICESSLQLFSL